jgi:hypothetical protein
MTHSGSVVILRLVKTFEHLDAEETIYQLNIVDEIFMTESHPIP